MAVDDLPMPVVNFLNVIGVPWPYINEDQLLEFATLVREFAVAVETTHQDATQAVAAIAESHKAASTQKMLNGWQRLSAPHVSEIVEACHALADGLELCAGYVVGQKVEAIGQLVIMAAEFVADQAASVATLGIAEAAVPVIVLAGKKLMKSLVQDLVQYAIGEVIAKKAQPLFAKVEAMMAGLDWSASGLGSAGGPGDGFELDPAGVQAAAALLQGHADTMRSHAGTLSSGLESLQF